MPDFIYVEPADRHRPAFATWGLRQDPPLQTASERGWDIPLDLYPLVPAELLDGAVVDGYLYNTPTVQPDPVTTPEPTPEPVDVVPVAQSQKSGRKRGTRTHKTSGGANGLGATDE